MDFAWKVVSTLGGAAVVLTALIGFAYWLFRTFSERWLQSKFDARLQSLRHAQNREIEQLRFRINALMDRATKLHEREYQILPQLWEDLASAWAETSAYTSPLQSMADVQKMTDEQLEEFLSDTDLLESQKQTVRESGDRNEAYRTEAYWHRKAKVTGHARTFSRALRFNSIFVPEDIKDRMKNAETLMWDALNEYSFNAEDKPMPRERTAQKRLRQEGEPLLDSIEQLIHKRLWSIAKLD